MKRRNVRLREPQKNRPYLPLLLLCAVQPMSVRELGKRTGFHFGHIARLIRGERTPGLAHLVRIARAVGCDISITLQPRAARRKRDLTRPRSRGSVAA